MPALPSESRTAPSRGLWQGGHGPRALVVLVVGVLAVASGLLVVSIDRIQTVLLERDAIAKGLRWTSGLLASLDSVSAVFEGGGLSDADRRTIELASRLGDLRAFLIFDRDGRVIAASDPAELGRVNVSGYWASEVLRGSPHAAIEEVPTADGEPPAIVAETYVPVRGSTDGRIVGAFEAYLDVSDSATAYRRIGGYASAVGVALIAAAGAVAVAFVRRTLSYRLERERMLAAAREAAEASSAAKSRFLATVSHEIRTPMNGVLATAELLASTPLGDDQRDMVAIIRRSGDALLELLNQVLDQSKIEAGKLAIVQAPFALAGLLSSVTELVRPAALAKGLSLSVHVAEELAEAVVGDEVRLRQVLLNLCGNAVKFTARGSVSVTATPADGANGIVDIRVADTGIGIAPTALDRLFSPFEQADASTTRRFGGTGLGLAISRELAELMGGSLSVTSEPDRGSVFTLRVPLPPAPPLAATAPPAEGWQRLGLEVLVADDDPTNRWVVGRQLERLGCRAVVVADGADALRLWRAEPGRWQAVVSDWHMPELDGLGLLTALRDEPQFEARRPLIVMMTASGLPEEIERAQRAGADRVLVKPVTLGGLSAALSDAVPESDAPVPAARPVLDVGELAALCGGDKAMLNDVLVHFGSRLSDGLEALSDSADSGRLASVAHALRGAAASVGAARLADACGRLEAASGAGDAERLEVYREAELLRSTLEERIGRREAGR